MKHMLRFCTMLALVLAIPASASTRTYFGFQIGISNAPPPPRVAFYEPDLMYIPDSHVYVVENDVGCDVFRYGSSWFLTSGGYWYRASRYRGPYQVCDVRYVPRPIFMVPASHWRYRNDRWNDGRGRGDVRYQQRFRYQARAWDRDRYGDQGRGRYGDNRGNQDQRARDYGNRDHAWGPGRSGDRNYAWNRGRDRNRGDVGDRQGQRNGDDGDRGRGHSKEGKGNKHGHRDSD